MINLEKHGFVKTEKNIWVGWKDYLLDDFLSNYGYYLRATLHEPYKNDSPDITNHMYKIIVHRYAIDREHIEQWLQEGESRIVYKGLIESEEYFEKLLINLGIK